MNEKPETNSAPQTRIQEFVSKVKEINQFLQEADMPTVIELENQGWRFVVYGLEDIYEAVKSIRIPVYRKYFGIDIPVEKKRRILRLLREVKSSCIYDIGWNTYYYWFPLVEEVPRNVITPAIRLMALYQEKKKKQDAQKVSEA